MNWDSLMDCRMPSLERKPEWNSLTLKRKCSELFCILVNLFPWVSLDSSNRWQNVSAIYLYPACQSSRTSCSPTTIWSNTTSLTSLLQKTWWQRKFLCFNKEQSEEFIEPLDLLSSLWACLLHPDHQAVPLSFQVTFCLSCIKKLLFLDCSPFVLFLEFLYSLTDFLFTPDLSHFEAFPVLTWIIFCLLFPLIFASFTLWDGCKSFLSLLCDIFSCPSMNLFKAFPGFLQVTNILKYYFQF